MNRKNLLWATLLLYIIAVAVIASYHELWRDEVVPISTVSESESLTDLFSRIHNFGHPSLWYVLLYGAYQIFPHFVVLKIVNFLIAILGVGIFLFKSPFRLHNKILFILGFFPLYLYPVLNRNYGISMLLLFLFCALYYDRFKKMIPLGITLFLLANTHAHSLIIVLAIFASLVFELTFKRNSLGREDRGGVFAGMAIIVVGILVSINQITPDHTSIVFSTGDLNIKRIMKAAWESLYTPGHFCPRVFGFESILFVNMIVGCLYVYFLRKPRLLIMFFLSVVGISMFAFLIYHTNDLRHQGVLFLLIIAMLWMDARSSSENEFSNKWLNKAIGAIQKYKGGVVTFLLIAQVLLGVVEIYEDVKYPYSSSQAFSAFVKANPDYSDAIIMGEPQANLESLPYYLDNPIYLHREQRFGKYRNLTTIANNEFSLSEFLEVAETLRASERKPVIILMGHNLKPEGPYHRKFSLGRVFTHTKESLSEFKQATQFLVRFDHSIRGENYNVYLLKE